MPPGKEGYAASGGSTKSLCHMAFTQWLATRYAPGAETRARLHDRPAPVCMEQTHTLRGLCNFVKLLPGRSPAPGACSTAHSSHVNVCRLRAYCSMPAKQELSRPLLSITLLTTRAHTLVRNTHALHFCTCVKARWICTTNPHLCKCPQLLQLPLRTRVCVQVSKAGIYTVQPHLRVSQQLLQTPVCAQ